MIKCHAVEITQSHSFISKPVKTFPESVNWGFFPPFIGGSNLGTALPPPIPFGQNDPKFRTTTLFCCQNRVLS